MEGLLILINKTNASWIEIRHIQWLFSYLMGDTHHYVLKELACSHFDEKQHFLKCKKTEKGGLATH